MKRIVNFLVPAAALVAVVVPLTHHVRDRAVSDSTVLVAESASKPAGGHPFPDHWHPPAPPLIKDGIATFEDTTSLNEVASACSATATTDRPGAVVVKRGVFQAGGRVSFDQDCVIQLSGNSDVTLINVCVSSQTVNFSDVAFGTASNHIALRGGKWTTAGGTGFLTELSDPDDEFRMDNAEISAPAGIVIQARGGRVEPDHGGRVLLARSVLRSADPDGEGIAVSASTQQGLVLGRQIVLDASAVGFVAGKCFLEIGPQHVDCREETLGAILKDQAAQAKAQQQAAVQ